MKRIGMIFLLVGLVRGADVTAWTRGDNAVANTVRWPAKQQAVKMFDSIGVSLEWMRERPAASQGVAIEVRFTTNVAAKSGVLAFTTPFDPKPVVTVLYDRIVFMSNANPSYRPTLLAHVLVHEISHVLMGTNVHSHEGVMKAHWTLIDHERMAHHPLPFLSEDAQTIRDSLASFTARK